MSKIRLALLTGAWLPVASSFALAQGATAPPQLADNSGGGVEEIVVTAQRRAENLQDVPVSISALSGQQLEKQRITNADDLTSFVPNLQVTGTVGEGTPIFALRGISMSDYSLNQAGPVATYFDEVYRGNFALLGVSMYDLERVEVLRGPQGTLYGKNTTGGAVNIIAKRPGYTTEGHLSAGYGNYDRFDLSGAVQSGLGEKVAARIAFTFARGDGWFKNLHPGAPDLESTREYGIRGSILFEPSDDLDFVLRASTSLQNPWGYGIIAQPGPDGIGAGVYALFNALDPVANPRADYFRTGLGRREVQADYNERRRNRTYAVSLTGNWQLSDALTLTSISSWDKGTLLVAEDTDGSPLQVLEIPYYDRARQIAQDLRLTSDHDGPFNFIAGAYYNDEKVFNRTNFKIYQDIDVNADGILNAQDCIDGLPVACQIQNSFDQRKKSYAIYSDLRYELNDNLTLRGGLRYTRDKGSQTNFLSQALGPDDVVVANLIPGDPNNLDATTSRHFKKDNLSGKIGVDYKTDGGTLFYASFSRGYRGSAFNAQAFFAPEELSVAKPETLDSYEVGFKSQLFDRRLQLNGALFYYSYKNQQFINLDPDTAAQQLVNLDKSRIIGAELELVARPTDNVRLSGGLGLLDTKIVDGVLQGTTLDGNELANAPSVSLTLAADWDVVQADWGTVSLHLDGSYSTEQWFEVFNRERLQQEGYALVNGRLGFRTADDSWGAAFWAKNIFDKYYYTSRIDVSGFGFDYNHIGGPRTYGFTVDYRF